MRVQKYYFFTKPLRTTIQNRRMHFLKINSLATVEALKNDEKIDYQTWVKSFSVISPVVRGYSRDFQ